MNSGTGRTNEEYDDDIDEEYDDFDDVEETVGFLVRDDTNNPSSENTVPWQQQQQQQQRLCTTVFCIVVGIVGLVCLLFGVAVGGSPMAVFVSQRRPDHASTKNTTGTGTPNTTTGIAAPLSLEPTPKDDSNNNSNSNNNAKHDESVPVDASSSSSLLLFQCLVVQPTTSKKNDIQQQQQQHALWYATARRDAIAANILAYLSTFRDTEYDNWGHSYREVQAAMAPWKRRHYTSTNIPSGAAIYESACGIGMNLFLTLEILQTVAPQVTNLTVYGNDLFPESVAIARSIVATSSSAASTASSSTTDASPSFPRNGRLGTICPADSTHLPHVPSDAFDLVFTGYISPLLNPLQFQNNDNMDNNNNNNNNDNMDANFAIYTADCEAQSIDARSVARRNAAQQKQNDWYAAWVGEMIRIAKPGAPVIVEQVSHPYVFVVKEYMCACKFLF